MMRRKLVVYTIMLIAGICAGFFIFEKAKLISGLMFMIGTGIAIFVVQPDTNQTGLKAERIICFCIMSLGLLLFAADYSRYESACPEAEHVRIYGRVLNAEDKSEYLRLTITDTENHRKVNVNVSKDQDEAADLSYYIGSLAEVTGTVKKLPEADNPGCFDYRRYMRSKGISYSIKADSVQMDESRPAGIHRIRKYLIKERETFLSHFEDENRGVLRGVIFGDKSEIDENVLKEFNMNSSGHILAVSGLHIGFLYSLLRLLSGRKKTLPISLIVIFLMTVYGEMTMWSSSTVRAVIVLSLSILSVNLRRPFDLLSSISAAAFMILLFRPYMLFNTGFQLSFAAMCSIAFLSKYLSAFLGELLGTAVSVQIGTIPLIAMSFHRVNSLALLINIPIIILSSLFVPLSIFVLFIGMAMAHLPGICISCINILCECLVSLNHILSFDGGFSNLVSGAGAAISISFYILIFAASSEWLRVNIIRNNYALLKKTFSIMLIPLMFMHICLYDALKGDEIVFVSVGQGDCTHIRCGKDDILIDGGGSDFVNTGERILMPYLLSQGAKDVDVAVLTHLHKDHYLGISELSELYPVRSVAMPSDYGESFENQKDDSISFNTGQIIYLDGESRISVSEDVSVEILWPLAAERGSIRIDDPNEHNMVYMINYKSIKVMVTGDLLEEDEIKMADYYKGSDSLKCNILKVAHHGSKSSSSEVFLDMANPEIAVIQVGRDNFYGHPHDQTLQRLEDRGIMVFRNDTDGAVGIDIGRNNKIKVHTWH